MDYRAKDMSENVNMELEIIECIESEVLINAQYRSITAILRKISYLRIRYKEA